MDPNGFRDRAIVQVKAYHDRSKHQLNRYARSLEYLDWATQPNPFRRFEGAPSVALRHPTVSNEPIYDQLFEGGVGGGTTSSPSRIDHKSISELFYYSLAISAWKQASNTARWSLRVNPSSGDLHPTEAYLICGGVPDLALTPGVFHYSPYHHALERRLTFSESDWRGLSKGLLPDSFLILLASIYWRESWKYGERAFRYCHHDVGHAIGAVTIAATTLGWHVRLAAEVSDDALEMLAGLQQQHGPEAEHPDCLLIVSPTADEGNASSFRLSDELRARLRDGEFEGEPNRLSKAQHAWPIIDTVNESTRHEESVSLRFNHKTTTTTQQSETICVLASRPVSASDIIRRRRSAVAMDGQTSIDRTVLFHMLARVTPASFPFKVIPWSPRISLAIFIHRVAGLPCGLYMLVRDPRHESSLVDALHREFLWQKPGGCPKGLRLYLLEEGDMRQPSKVISCHQDIASDGAFSLGMLAEFEASLNGDGPSIYPRLFWETGLIGQVLYLEAEATGIRATGIGCFFDDVMHEVLGIEDHAWQSLYHFTVGGAVDDSRLQTLPPYSHLSEGDSP